MAREMKDSGIEWIGEIPDSWERTKLLHLLRQAICDGPHETPCLLENGIPFISVDSLNSSERVDLAKCKKFISQEDYDRYRVKANIEENDILFTKAATIGKTAIVGKETFMVWSPIAIVKTDNAIADNKFVYHLLNCPDLIQYISLLGSYNTQINVGMRELEKAIVPLPPLPEQQRIANYLDKKCVEIDSVIAATQRTIEEYKKLKQSVITQAVTKGIRGKRPMKDSGIAWIGDISFDFEIKKLKYLCYILDQFRSPIPADKRNQDAEVLYDYYGASGAIDKIDGYTIDDHVMLIGEDGANLRMRNLPLMYEVNGKAWINNHAHILKPKEDVDFYFLFYALECLDLNTYITGSAQPKLSQDNLRNIWVPVPSYEEQKEIARYVKEKCAALDQLIASKQQLISELEFYKKSVIYEYVTGKKEVPACQ